MHNINLLMIQIDLSKTKYLDNMIQIIRLEWNTTWASLHDNNLGNES